MFGLSRFGNAAPVDLERRQQRRERVLLGGRIGYLAGNFRCDCTVRDLSTTGARVVPSTLFLPRPDPFLMVMSRGLLHRAAVVWCADGSFGLRFSASWDLVDSMSKSPEQFRNWWLDLARN